MYLFYIILLVFNGYAHDIHLSKTEIRFKPDQSAIQISAHIFIDDLEIALESRIEEKLNLCTKKEHFSADSLIWAYINEQLFLTVDNKELEFEWVGKEISEDLAAVWCFLEVPIESISANLEIHNTVLMELYDDQKNIVTFQNGSAKKEHMFFDIDSKPKFLEY